MKAGVGQYALAREGTRETSAAPLGIEAAGSPRWLLYYYVIQFLCQLALIVPALGSGRVLFRSAAFGMSLVALVLSASRKGTKSHPAAVLALIAILILGLEMFHPDTSGSVGAVATVALNLAILAPIFWVPRLAIDVVWFRRIVIVIWAFQSVSAFFGALQSYFPGEYQPAVSTLLNNDNLAGLSISLANGHQILRPCGLTDTPGGAAVAGTYAILLGLGLWLDTRKYWQRGIILFTMCLGTYAIYLCQVRSLLVMVGLSLLAAGFLHLMRGKFRSVIAMSVLIGVVTITSFVAAVYVGGDQTSDRFATLLSGSPGDVYYSNRGFFLEDTVTNLLPKYPLGAGLARWGMIGSYFAAAASKPIYVEIQWTGWLLDGGAPLILTYLAMLGVTLVNIWRTAKRRPDLLGWGSMMLGYSIGTIALTFNFPVFVSSFGIDFWLLNAALFAISNRGRDTNSSAAASAGTHSYRQSPVLAESIPRRDQRHGERAEVSSRSVN